MTRKLLEGRNALVVGGSSGIGLAIAQHFSELGARLAIVGRDEEKLKLAAEKINALGIVADVAKNSHRTQLLKDVTAGLGPVDILVNSQGVNTLKPAEDFCESEFDELININQRSVFFTCVLFGRGMLERGAGSIVNIASLSAHRGFRLAVPYTMSKHGVLGLTRALAAEWTPRGVRVNSISPGFFMTNLNQNKMDAKRKELALARTPLGRFGKLEELCGAAEFLVSPASQFVSGIDVPVDGAFLASGI